MYGLILAGGSGSRLWPLSRELYPKQLLDWNRDKTLLQSTFERLSAVVSPEKIISITNNKHASNVRYQLESMFENPNLLLEPIAKNTAPAIAVAAKYISSIAQEEDPVVIVLPSDHLINDLAGFKKSVEKAEKLAEEGYIVTFGVKPSYPETGFGYISVDENFKVKSFVEKPDKNTANKYLEEKTYFWNSGIFMFKISALMKEMNAVAPEITDRLSEIDFSNSKDIPYISFEKMPSISIDYAVMEKSKNIALVQLESDWKDVGSWRALYDISEKDKDGNVFVGHALNEKSKNTFAYSTSRLIAAIGLEDTVIVETEDAVLACKSDCVQDVEKVYYKLKEINDETHKVHKTVLRPWGFYTVIADGDGFLTKKIHVSAGQKLSVQSHNHRSEHWVIASGKAKVILGDEEFLLSAGESIDIPVKAKHSLQNPYDESLEIIELQMGSILLEEDIIRYEDIYGRT